jgi:Ser/Thr protein kinase RdoA (MazF antagonist)
MPGQGSSTHEIEVDGSEVVKRFRSWEGDEARREWRALTLLAEFAPGLAPVPVREDTNGDQSSIRMTRLPGKPLSGQTITAQHLDAIAAALNRLHACIPASVLGTVPPVSWLAEGMAARMRSLTSSPPPHDDPGVRVAYHAARRWIDQAAGPAGQPAPVFGQRDGSLDNFLWDGEGVRIVDFEHSGRSDLAFELAALVEHVSVWFDAGIEAGLLLNRFALTPAQSAQVLFYRRTFSIYWLYVLHHRPSHADVPPRQADRLVTLLASDPLHQGQAPNGKAVS